MRRIQFTVLLGLLLALPAGGRGAAAGAAAAAAGAAAAGTGGKAFSETTQVTAIEVPVQVVRDGEPVRGLTAADFEVFEGRKQQAITGFDVVDLAAPESQRLSASIPAAGRRHFLLIFDLTNSDPKGIVKARTAVAQSLLKTLTPADLVGMAAFGANSGLKLVLGFTSDRRQILKAIDTLGLSDLTDHMHHDPMLLTMAALSDALDIVPETAPPDGVPQRQVRAAATAGKADAGIASLQMMISLAAAESLANQRADLSAVSNQVTALTQSFGELARTMAAVSGRKLVVYFSEGFDSTILQGVDDIGDQQAIADTTMHGLGWTTESEERFGSTRSNNRVEKMLEAFRRSGCVIESVDIGGLRGDQDLDMGGNRRPSGEAALFQMAHDTGGELFHNFNDLSEAMARLARSTSLTYVLTFQPEGPLAAGSYHAINVKLKNPPRGARVTFRPGYYAPRPYTQERPLEKMLAASDQLMSGNAGGSIATAVLAAPFRAGAAKTKAYVPVIIEADGATLLAGNAGKTVPAEIYAYAVDAQGSILDYFDQTLRLDVEKAGPALRQGGLKFFGHLELPAGEYSVRVLLRNGETGAYGKRAVLVTVPAFTGEEPVLLPPFFPEASGRWTVVRESPRGEQKDVSYPFIVGQRAYVPAALPSLRPGEAVAVALVGYNLGGGQLEAKASVQGPDGSDLGGGDLSLAGGEPGGGVRPEVWKAVFRAPRGLPPGQYRLIVTVTGPGGAQTGTSPFAVPAAAPAG
jgi:VWFA-related protein